jgi:hypothetical protein
MDLPTIISENPLQTANINTQPDNPEWLCKHAGAKVIDNITRRYYCLKCNPKGGRIRKCPQPLFLSVLRK